MNNVDAHIKGQEVVRTVLVVQAAGHVMWTRLQGRQASRNLQAVEAVFFLNPQHPTLLEHKHRSMQVSGSFMYRH
jgi:hypothetical protein